jgi:hypothetical protein
LSIIADVLIVLLMLEEVLFVWSVDELVVAAEEGIEEEEEEAVDTPILDVPPTFPFPPLPAPPLATSPPNIV